MPKIVNFLVDATVLMDAYARQHTVLVALRALQDGVETKIRCPEFGVLMTCTKQGDKISVRAEGENSQVESFRTRIEINDPSVTEVV